LTPDPSQETAIERLRCVAIIADRAPELFETASLTTRETQALALVVIGLVGAVAGVDLGKPGVLP
jgi:hypothetical protein